MKINPGKNISLQNYNSMDIIVNKVFDTLKFAYFMSIKYNYPLSYMNAIIESINKYGPIKFYDLLECEIRYLQRSPLEYGKYFIAINKPICDLKIINMEKESKINSMKKHQFKLFDQVLVRDSNLGLWRANFYSHRDDIGNHVCISGVWNYCIPHNEQTAHLVGTNKPYEEPEPKVWRVTNPSVSFDETYTAKELSNFIKTAVINNKDITNFHVMYINPDN